MEVVMHRFVLAEFNTHRDFSRNSASSRAIPVHKQIDRIKNQPTEPVLWPAEKPGMQGGEELTGLDLQMAREVWDKARENALYTVELLQNLGVHKSVSNRLLEPFMWHVVIVSSTKWDNFWRQRCSPLAQPEMKAAAEAMRAAYEASTAQVVSLGGWHLPLVHDDEGLDLNTAKKCSVARVTRVSRENHDTGTVDIGKDFQTYDNLIHPPAGGPPHASPLEHVATPCAGIVSTKWVEGHGFTGIHPDGTYHLGNFVGWDQLRHQVLGF